MKRPSHLLSAVGSAVLQSINDPSVRHLRYMDGFDAFDALIRQLPENSAVAALLMLKRYGCPQIVSKEIRYA